MGVLLRRIPQGIMRVPLDASDKPEAPPLSLYLQLRPHKPKTLRSRESDMQSTFLSSVNCTPPEMCVILKEAKAEYTKLQ
jgi:hypothetical protein